MSNYRKIGAVPIFTSLLLTSPVSGAEYIINSIGDNEATPGTLRYVLANISTNDTVFFDLPSGSEIEINPLNGNLNDIAVNITSFTSAKSGITITHNGSGDVIGLSFMGAGDLSGGIADDFTFDIDSTDGAYGFLSYDALTIGDFGATLTVDSTGDEAAGISVEGNLVTSSFTGNISSNTSAGKAYGIYGEEITINGDGTGTISVSTLDGSHFASAIYSVFDTLTVNGNLGGTLSANSDGHQAYTVYAYNENIYIDGDLSADITAATTLSDARALFSEGAGGSANIYIGGDMSGNITATAGTSYAYGFHVENNHIFIDGDLSGDITVSAGWDEAYGLSTDGGNISINNVSGDITATAGGNHAYGLYADGNVGINGDYTGDIAVDAGNSYAYGISSDNIFIVGSIDGNISSQAGNTDAYGIHATNNINILDSIAGDITVSAFNEQAYGIYTTGDNSTVSTGGSISGDILVTAGDYGYGIHLAGEDTSLSINRGISGDISTNATINHAYGINVHDGDISIFGGIEGDITVTAGASDAYGLITEDDGNITIFDGIQGNITVTAGEDDAYGFFARDNITITGDMAGDIRTEATIGNDAYGLFANSDITVDGDVTGDIATRTGLGNAYGFNGQDVIINGNINGDINSHAGSAGAYGIFGFTEVSIGGDISGDIFADTGGSGAYAVTSLSGDLTVLGDVSGDITVKAVETNAWGLSADNELSIGGGILGNVTAEADISAYGIYTDGNNSSVTIADGISGNISSTAGAYGAGIYLEGEDTTLTIDGGISGDLTTTTTYNHAYGIYLYDGDITISDGIQGDLTVTAGTSRAYGLRTDDDGDVTINGDVSGDITVKTAIGDYAYGISADDIIIINGDYAGDITVEAGDDFAYGMRADYVVIQGDLVGNISSQAGAWRAYGIFAEDEIIINGDITGNITADSGNFIAYALYTDADDITINGDILGDITATTTSYNGRGISADDNLTILGGLYGDVTVNTEGASLGIFAEDDITITDGIHGDISVSATEQYAYGINTLYDDSTVTIQNGISGNIVATTEGNFGYGIRLAGSDNFLSISGGISGDITANANNSAYGFYLWNGDITISDGIQGDITAIAGESYGCAIYGRDITFAGGGITGDITAQAGTHHSAGIYATGNLTIQSELTGDVSAIAGEYEAFGLHAGGDLLITDGISGDITATAQTSHTAIGIYAVDGALNGGGGTTPLLISGNISAIADGLASGIAANDGMNLDISGTISGTDNEGTNGFAIKSGREDSGAWIDGAADDTIYLRSSANITGDIDLADGNDTVVTEIGPTNGLNGIIDLGDGTDHLTYAGGTWLQNDPHALNFEDYEINASAPLALVGDWDIGTKTAVVNGGSLHIQDTLTGGGLTINSGSATISGSANIAGLTSVDGALDVDGELNTGHLAINGSTDISGLADVAGDTTVNGTLNVSGQLNSGNLYGNNYINLSGAAYIDGMTDISGDLDLIGTLSTGTFSLSGSADITGNATADSTDLSGTMNLNGTLNSPSVDITSTGYLSGNGTINGNVVNSGTISPGNSIGKITVNGDLSFKPGSNYIAELTRHTSDKLVVNGKTNISGGTVKTSIPRSLYKNKDGWTILTATGGVNGRFDGLVGTKDTTTLSFDLGYSATSVGIYVTRTPYETFGATSNDSAVGGALDAIVPIALGSATDMEQFLIELDFDTTAEQITQALADLNPEIYSSFVDMELISSREFAEDITTRMHHLRESKLHLTTNSNLQGLQNIAEESEGKVQQISPSRGWNLWTQMSASATKNGENEDSGYEIRSERVTIGGDSQLYDWLLIGVAMGVNQSDLDYNLSSNSGDQKGIRAAFYGDANYSNFYLNTILSYGDFSNDSERPMTFLGTTSEGSFDGSSFSAQLGTGYDFSLSNWQVGPAVEAGIARVEIDSFNETGNRSAATLTIEEQAENHTYGRLGVKAASVYKLGSTALLPRLGFGFQHTSSEGADVNAYFIGYDDAMFTVTGADTPENIFAGEVGLTALIGSQLSLYGRLNSALGDDYCSYGFSAGLHWRF